MSSSSRLTLYSVLSALESDLRRIISVNLDTKNNYEEILSEDIYEKCMSRMERDIGGKIEDLSLSEILDYADFGDSIVILNKNKEELSDGHRRFLRKENKNLESLIPIRNRVAHSRPLAFDDLSNTLDVARSFSDKYNESFVELGEILQKLEEDPSFVLGVEIPNIEIDNNSEKHNLPLPDFDETGFVGRKEQVKNLINLCLGPYPVITIVGDGGLGKTALALKVAYDLLEIKDSQFEAIVWVSSKTTKLTSNDIVEIDGAIEDSLGMMSAIADRLAGKTESDVTDEIISYLKEFKILLILDNLETVLDDRIRKFLERLPNGSKIMVTSRIGLGAYEHPLKLQPLSKDESVQLLRSLATIRNVPDLLKVSNNILIKYCQRMNNNPGFIKWFVSAVQTGLRPEEVLANPDVFLDFCMSNVYEYLEDDSKLTLMAMQCLPGRHSQAELAYLLDSENITSLQHSLQQLLTTNMVRMHSAHVGSTFESKYEIAEMARDYLTKHHPPAPAVVKRFSKKRRQLKAAGDMIRSEMRTNKYNINSLKMRSSSDAIIAKYLNDALKNTKRKDYRCAMSYVDKSKQLAPDYFEVHRVEGFIKAKMGDIAGARDAYEAALDLEPDWPPLRLWYGGFLMRSYDDFELAIENFDAGLKRDENSYNLLAEKARANLYLKNFKEAENGILKLAAKQTLTTWQKKIVYDLHLQSRYRWAEYLIDEHDPNKALDLLVELKVLYEKCPKNLLDDTMKEHISKSARTAIRVFYSVGQGTSESRRIEEYIKWLIPITGESGYVSRMDSSRTEFTIETLNNDHYRGYSNNMIFKEEVDLIEDGLQLFFHVRSNDNSRQARNIIIAKK
ncbi:MAG: NB-ARC domain-containing protein [Pseudomonadota bacterium]|nr:NB-ARC domain-containing protein [Pseudomonadota bacterium]